MNRSPALFILLLSLPAAVSAAELRTGTVVYDGGAAAYQMAPSQHVICDKCPPLPRLAPAVIKPMVKATPSQDLAPEVLSVEGIIPSPVSSMHTVASEKAAPVMSSQAHECTHPLTTVYFVFNSSRLRPEEKLRLRKAIAAGIDSDVVIRVEGHTCRIGKKRYNIDLSRRRAAAVSAYLRKLGIPVREVVGLGKSKPLGGALSRDRRAEIIIKERNYIP